MPPTRAILALLVALLCLVAVGAQIIEPISFYVGTQGEVAGINFHENGQDMVSIVNHANGLLEVVRHKNQLQDDPSNPALKQTTDLPTLLFSLRTATQRERVLPTMFLASDPVFSLSPRHHSAFDSTSSSSSSSASSQFSFSSPAARRLLGFSLLSDRENLEQRLTQFTQALSQQEPANVNGADNSAAAAAEQQPSPAAPQPTTQFDAATFQLANNMNLPMTPPEPYPGPSPDSSLLRVPGQLKVINGLLRSVTPTPFVVAQTRQWKLFAHDDFEEHANGWSTGNQRQQCGDNGDEFLGGYCKFGGRIRAAKTFDQLPPHDYVRIKARYHFFDKWTGQSGRAEVDKQVVWTRSRVFCTKVFSMMCKGINVCGDDMYADTLSAHIDITMPHRASSVEVALSSTLPATTSPCEASWGVDDVMVFTL